MPVGGKIEDLVHLLGAESQAVREAVADELIRGAYDLKKYLAESKRELAPEVLFQIHELLRRQHDGHIRRKWTQWLEFEDEYLQLEAGLSFLAETQQQGAGDGRSLSDLLDDIVRDFLEHEVNPSVFTLNRYLFQEKRFAGNTRDYYHPLNSNLCQVILSGKGLPISLACIFILCGSRLALKISGFNMRGHFLARSDVKGKTYLIDCFNEGRVIDDTELRLLSQSDPEGFRHLLDNPAKPMDIIVRILHNLIHAHFRTGDLESYHLVQDLLADLQAGGDPKQDSPEAPAAAPGIGLFQPGQLVRHKRYGYRGVVVACDKSCQADENWYRANLTQPDRDQPWYHVLVDRSNLTTYAAQTSLDADGRAEEIHHPLVPLFFEDFQGNRYVRNDVPWILPG